MTQEQEAQHGAKMKATMARKRAERDAINQGAPAIQALREEAQDLKDTLEQERRESTRLKDNLAAMRDLEHDAREQLHIFMESTRVADIHIQSLTERVNDLVIQRSTIERQRDALQSLVMIHSARGGSLDGAISLLLAALGVEGDDQGHCVWCRQNRLDGDAQGTEPHTESCPIGQAMLATQ